MRASLRDLETDALARTRHDGDLASQVQLHSAWNITQWCLLESDEVHQLTLVAPGGFFDAVNKMNAPAERLDLPTDADTITYAKADLMHTIQVFEQYGLRFLTAEEIHATMPDYPTRRRLL